MMTIKQSEAEIEWKAAAELSKPATALLYATFHFLLHKTQDKVTKMVSIVTELLYQSSTSL